MVSARVTHLFFDRPAVIAAMDRKTARALPRFGVIVQREAKKSLKYGERSSTPGQPPTVHRGDKFTRTIKRGKKAGQQRGASPLRELLFYSFDPKTKSVVIGPERWPNSRSKNLVPKTLEHGGEVSITHKGGTVTILRVAPHPFMLPALRRKAKEAPPQWGEKFTGPLK